MGFSLKKENGKEVGQFRKVSGKGFSVLKWWKIQHFFGRVQLVGTWIGQGSGFFAISRLKEITTLKMAPNMTEAETVKFLLLCIEKCDTKSIDWEQIAEASGLSGQKAAYKKLWDLKSKLKKNTDGGSSSTTSPTKVKKSRSTKTSPRKKRKVNYSEDRDEEEAPPLAQVQDF
ncbi:uncharacterized protein DFL_002635 [Arthrobotrys flagrans]|uniref:Myb-like DNA-binding domain-containing protein n=1 Tax=Arthrobotrys flagrans TaxID=97331 RepID=A0A437ACB0_ARTFL|nr:hypothetical protein DFL_002635 [Arthrobotrys flagrans]